MYRAKQLDFALSHEGFKAQGYSYLYALLPRKHGTVLVQYIVYERIQIRQQDIP